MRAEKSPNNDARRSPQPNTPKKAHPTTSRQTHDPRKAESKAPPNTTAGAHPPTSARANPNSQCPRNAEEAQSAQNKKYSSARRDKPIDQIGSNLTAPSIKIQAKVMCCRDKAPITPLYSITRIPSSNFRSFNPRQTGCSYLGGSYPSAGDAAGKFLALPAGTLEN